MTGVDALRFSRVRATAKGLAAAPDSHRFVEKPVLLTGTPEVLASPNGAEMAHCAILLLMRMSTSVTVALPEGFADLAQQLAQWGDQHAWDVAPQVTLEAVNPDAFDAVLSLGGPPRPGRPWTVITCEGWLARCTSGPTPIAQSCGQANPITALAAASLGVAEIFKRLLPLRQDRGVLLDGCVFSLWSYDSGESVPGPSLPATLNIDLLIAGAGAIGNGVAHLLSRLPLTGRAAVLDAQAYGEENWGTCLRLSRDAAQAPKAPFLAALLGDQLETTSIEGYVEAAEARADWRTPPVVLSGFDNVDARYAVQNLWPDVVIDGAIGPALECQVTAHPWASRIGCLRCIFDRPSGPRAEVAQGRLSGLASEALADLSRTLSAEDIAAAAPSMQTWLAHRLGKPICSILTEAQALAGASLQDGFRPSVPFVATMSAAMMVTEMVRYMTTGSVGVEPKFFFSLLWGPDHGDAFPEDRHADCVCTTRSANINRVRERRCVDT